MTHRLPVWRLLAVCLVFSGFVGSASATASTVRWHLCTQSAGLGAELDDIARRIALRATGDGPAIVVQAVPHGDGSTELLIAASTRLLDQLRDRLKEARVPHRRVRFELVSETESPPNGAWPAKCRGVPVRVELLP